MEEGGRRREGTHHTKCMEAHPIHLVFLAEDGFLVIRSATQHACWRGERSTVSALRGQVPPGAVPGAALCRPCQLRGRAGGRGGQGALQAQQCQQAAAAQPWPPWPRSTRALRAPASPLRRRQTPSTPLPGGGELRAGILCSHPARSSRRPPASPRTSCASTVSLAERLSRQHQAFSSA